jgi:hypothetical protein
VPACPPAGEEEVGQLDLVVVGQRQDPAVLDDHLALDVEVLGQRRAQLVRGGWRGQLALAGGIEDARQAVHPAAQFGRDPDVEVGRRIRGGYPAAPEPVQHGTVGQPPYPLAQQPLIVAAVHENDTIGLRHEA